MSQLKTVFFGASTILVSDGTSSILVDGFFTRPPLLKLFTKISPDEATIDRALVRAGIQSLEMVVVSHSHADHALDAPIVAQKTGALLAGTESTRMIALGYGVGDTNFVPLADGIPRKVGVFTVTPIRALHSENDRYPGEISTPVKLPAKTSAFRTGGCFSFHFDHPEGRILVHPTANFIPGALDDYPSDVIFLGAGGAGLQDQRWRNRYWDETVVATGAYTVLPIHWDRFWRPLEEPLRPLPKSMDVLEDTIIDWQIRANAAHLDLRMPQPCVEDLVRVRH